MTNEQLHELFDGPTAWELIFVALESAGCVGRLPRGPESLRSRRQHAQGASPRAGDAPGAANALLTVSYRLYAPGARRLGGHDASGAEWPGPGVALCDGCAAQPDLKGRVHAFLHAKFGAQRTQWGTA
jgi:hypothetical protein